MVAALAGRVTESMAKQNFGHTPTEGTPARDNVRSVASPRVRYHPANVRGYIPDGHTSRR